ncbi:unnamed protein product [Clonostachys solani]|uniref:Uncharacterized protein n=1 Tax=Clonostachys solani TaxID=160281 RepID=A0A9P0E7W5_9HYPO|nr:unnamed protein product [Clonostachys solani]
MFWIVTDSYLATYPDVVVPSLNTPHMRQDSAAGTVVKETLSAKIYKQLAASMSAHLSDAQLKELAYEGQFDDHPLGENLPSVEALLPINCRQGMANIGTLGRLTPECLQIVFNQLDIDTIISFQSTSHGSFALVNSLPTYGVISKHARNAVRGARIIGTSNRATCIELYSKLCQPACDQCEEFGGYIYLVTYRRLCLLCLSTHLSFLPLGRQWARRYFGLDSSTVNSLPRLLTLGGRYSPEGGKLQNKQVLVDYDAAREAGISRHGSQEGMEAYVAAARGRAGRRRGPPDGKAGNPLRFAAAVRLPWYDESSGELEWGFHCRGCEKSEQRSALCRKKYNAVSFRRHIQTYGPVQDGEHRKCIAS